MQQYPAGGQRHPAGGQHHQPGKKTAGGQGHQAGASGRQQQTTSGQYVPAQRQAARHTQKRSCGKGEKVTEIEEFRKKKHIRGAQDEQLLEQQNTASQIPFSRLASFQIKMLQQEKMLSLYSIPKAGLVYRSY